MAMQHLVTVRSQGPPTISDAVARLRVAYPFLRAMKMDYLFRQIILLQALEMNHRENNGVVVADDLEVTKVLKDKI